MQRSSKSKPSPTPRAPGAPVTPGTPRKPATKPAPSSPPVEAPALGAPKPQPARKRRQARLDLSATITATKPKPAASATATKPATKRPRLSALDAAAQILAALTAAEAKDGITSQELIERMAKQKLWTSPGGKTPHATLYAAIVREITAKGVAARFRKVSKGHFTAQTPGSAKAAPSTKKATA